MKIKMSILSVNNVRIYAPDLCKVMMNPDKYQWQILRIDQYSFVDCDPPLYSLYTHSKSANKVM